MKTFKFLLPVALLVLTACNSQDRDKEVKHENHQQSEMKDEQKEIKRNHEEITGKVEMEGTLKNLKSWKNYRDIF